MFVRTGAAALGFIRYARLLAAFLYLSAKMVWVGRHLGRRDFLAQVLNQIYFTAVQAVGPVVVLALSVGVVAIAEGVGRLGALSGADALARTITVIVLREVAPFLTGVIVIVRSVTAIAAELGVMRVQREIEALDAMGIPPIRQLVTPRVFGGLVSFACLDILFAAVALAGGFVVAQLFAPIPASLFFGSALAAVSLVDLAAICVKLVVSGLGIFVIACFHGMDVRRSPTEVPIAASRAALNALVFLVLVHTATSIAVFLTGGAPSLVGGFLP